MIIWQADFYKHLSQRSLWQLIICDTNGNLIKEATCPQAQVNHQWLKSQLEDIIHDHSPDIIQVFRPQSLNLFKQATETLKITIQATRRTPELKKLLIQKDPNLIKLEQLPPQPLPENLWGDKWLFASFKAGDIVDYFSDRPIPIKDFPEDLKPINLGIPSTVNIPGVVIYGGRNSLYLVRWLADKQPVSLNYIPTEVGKSGGLILESGLVERSVLLTFEDPEMAKVAQKYEQQKESSQGLHFLLIQPDDSGMTQTGIWLLKKEAI
ncbi:MAG: Tab2 family RNA-binding protein [Crocosphaera sp.]